MSHLGSIFFFGCILLLGVTNGQIGKRCGVALEDIPNAASDTCTAFYRCFRFAAYSMRCPAGQAFHYDRKRCRPAQEVDCPLQLQRFQAPGVPSYLRPQENPEIEIRVIQAPSSQGNPGSSLAFAAADGTPIAVTRQDVPGVAQQNRFFGQNPGHIRPRGIASHPNQPAGQPLPGNQNFNTASQFRPNFAQGQAFGQGQNAGAFNQYSNTNFAANPQQQPAVQPPFQQTPGQRNVFSSPNGQNNFAQGQTSGQGPVPGINQGQPFGQNTNPGTFQGQPFGQGQGVPQGQGRGASPDQGSNVGMQTNPANIPIFVPNAQAAANQQQQQQQQQQQHQTPQQPQQQ